MNVAITGGAGFIGSHLASAYLEKGDEVAIIDDLSTGYKENIHFLQSNPEHKKRLSVKIDTILNPRAMAELIGPADLVFHLAAAVGVRYIIENPLESIKTNIQGTEMVLDLCSRFDKKVLIASSSEVYGKHLHAPLVETDNVVYGPSTKSRWSYAASKLMDEFTALAYHSTKELNVVIARLFNTVGPRQTGAYGMVIPRFIEQALKNLPITVYGDGTQTRTFTYVKDVVHVLMELMKHQQTVGEVFNIGGTEEISIYDLAQKIVAKTNSKSVIEKIPYEKAFKKDFEDMQRRVPSIEKVKSFIGFEPMTDLDTILTHTIAYIKNTSALQTS
ncbi:MAG: GDP-mannose 4,6-dehydratase [Desulfobacterales bacterium]